MAPDLTALEGLSGSRWGFAANRLFAGEEFGEVLYATQLETDGPLYVLEQPGILSAISPEGRARTKLLDLSDRVYFEQGHEAGALGLALRPEADELYLFYVTSRDGELYDRVSRFAWRGTAVDPQSEQVLIEQRHEWHRRGGFAEHFAGGLAFGPDGHLYIAFGDEGWVPNRTNPQKLDLDFFSGILRIDVDCDPERSHPPTREPATGTTDGYCIPNDNPFVGLPNVLEEFYLIGLRNPYRFSFDRETGALWMGDAGSDKAEEINLGVPGGNYQWSYREGVEQYKGSFLKGKKPSPFYGVERPPLFAYPHGSGNGCIIGGHVYRGREHPGLTGHYVFGDINSGRIWALLADASGHVLRVEQITQVPPYSLLSFGEDARGEILLLGRPRLGVTRLSAVERGGSNPPALSETGLFDDLATLAPAPGVIPYEPKLPSWTDGAIKRHWAAIPGDGSNTGGATKRDRVLYRHRGPLGFPAGSVFVQHLELPVDDAKPEITRPIETRLLVLSSDGGARAFAYKWNDAGTDAFAVAQGDTTRIRVRAKDGTDRVVEWVHPTPSDCLTCHHLGNGHVLGVTARQLDRDILYPDTDAPMSQLRAWNAAGMFSMTDLKLIPPGGAKPSSAVTLHTPNDPEATLDARARSYLDANCAFCHGPAGALFDLRRESPLAPLIHRPVRHDFGHDGARLLVPGEPDQSLLYLRLAAEDASEQMPPLGRRFPDPDGVTLIREWIASMPPTPPVRPQDEGTQIP